LAPVLAARDKIPAAERLLFDSVNRERAERKLPVLKWDAALATAARKHAELMAEHSLLLHRITAEPDLVTRARLAGAGFSHITENIGMAAYASGFHDGWMRSPGHRANILDPEVDSVGIAVVEGGDQLFAVEDFSRAVVLLSVEEQKQRVTDLLAARGLHLLEIGKDADDSCPLERDFTGRTKPKYVAHYETPDLSQLPESLEKALQSSHYKSAAVAACDPKDPTRFTLFRIVVLLYR
jgi:hypothetical protein